jgi:hypothetical protein
MASSANDAVKPLYSSSSRTREHEGDDANIVFTYDYSAKNLENVGESTLQLIETSDTTQYLKGIESAYNKKRGIDLTRSNTMFPMINVSGKVLYLPSTVKDEDNLLVQSMAVLGEKLGYTVRTIPYGERKVRELSVASLKLATGVSFAVLDGERKFNIHMKEDLYELGRTYARAQQIIGAVEAKQSLSLDCLKRNNRFFGNNPSEVSVDGKVRTPVSYLAKTIEHCFIEEEWGHHLRIILNTLLRRSHILVDQDVLTAAVKDNIIQYSECVTLFATREVVITPGAGKRPSITARRVPKKPKANSLLLKSEMAVIDGISDDLFKALSGTDKDSWYEAIINQGWKTIKTSIVERANHRSEYLAKFASMTTKRLNEIRKISDSNKTKRKRDVTSTDVTSMLERRLDRLDTFAKEILSLDPTGKLLLGKYFSKHHTNFADKAACRVVLVNLINDHKCYESINQALDADKIASKLGDIHLGLPLTPFSSSGTTSKVAAEFCKNEDNHEMVREIVRRVSQMGKLQSLDDLNNLVFLANQWVSEDGFKRLSKKKDMQSFLLEKLMDFKLVPKSASLKAFWG